MPATRELALWVIRRLRRAGFEALLAGGCVRDMLLGVRPSDYDVATDANPQQVRRLFKRVVMVGAKFGVTMVLRDKRAIEVATFRSDLSYSDGRRPDKVVFSSPREDALRRDFTINGMFMDPVGREVIDYVDGQSDLAKHIVRAIGSPDERFAEDYLRMLRAVRFTARLGFALDRGAARAIRRHAPNIRSISGERIREELEKMLSGPHSEQAMALTSELGLVEPIFGAVAEEAWRGAMDRLARLAGQRDATLSLAAILAGAGAGTIRRLTRHWGASNEMRNTLLWLTRHVDAWQAAAEMPLPDFKRLMAHPAWNQLRKLWRAEELRRTGRDAAGRRAARRASGIDPRQVRPAPLITGEDLKEMGFREGPPLGRALGALYDLQLAEEIRTRRQAMEQARRLLGG